MLMVSLKVNSTRAHTNTHTIVIRCQTYKYSNEKSELIKKFYRNKIILNFTDIEYIFLQ